MGVGMIKIPEDCPYNIQRVTEFQAACGEYGYEAIIREWGHRIGVLIAPPLPIYLRGFAGADEVRFGNWAESLDLTPELFAVALVDHYKSMKTFNLDRRAREKYVAKEIQRLEKELKKGRVLFRLLGFKPQKWDWIGVQNLASAKAFLESRYPNLEIAIDLATLLNPNFELPY